MSLQHDVNLRARDNQWMNNNVCQLASTLNADELLQNRGAFFGSVVGILNDLLVADLICLNRFKQLAIEPKALQPLSNFPLPTALDQLLFPDFKQLHQVRTHIDTIFLTLCVELDQQQLQQV